MTPGRRDSGIDVLDPRFPVALTMPASCFWELAALRPDRAALPALAARARGDEAVAQERYVTPAPRFVPALAHEATAADMGLTAGWWRDTPAREGMPQPGDTDTFIAHHDQAQAEEAGARERRPVRRARRAIAAAARAVRQQPPAAGEL